MATNEDPDQEQSDLGLHCLPRPACAKTVYRKIPKNSDTRNICCNHPKIWTKWLYCCVMCPEKSDGMANSVGPDHTAPLGGVWSGSALFA